MEPEALLPCSRKPTIVSSRMRVESILHLYTLFLEVWFNINFPSTHIWPSIWPLILLNWTSVISLLLVLMNLIWRYHVPNLMSFFPCLGCPTESKSDALCDMSERASFLWLVIVRPTPNLQAGGPFFILSSWLLCTRSATGGHTMLRYQEPTCYSRKFFSTLMPPFCVFLPWIWWIKRIIERSCLSICSSVYMLRLQNCSAAFVDNSVYTKNC
jgi:hypothetical protein